MDLPYSLSLLPKIAADTPILYSRICTAAWAEKVAPKLLQSGKNKKRATRGLQRAALYT